MYLEVLILSGISTVPQQRESGNTKAWGGGGAVLFSHRAKWDGESEGIVGGECSHDMQCNLGAKVKATDVHVATGLRPPVTSECGLLSPSLI